MGIEKEVENDALDAIDALKDEIIAKVIEVRGEVPKEMLEYSDTYQYERINLGYQNPRAAVDTIESLAEHEAIADFGGEWRDGLAYLAEETYRNAVISRFSELMGQLNSKITDAEFDGKIVWELPEPERPTGVLEWTPDLDRKMRVFEERQRRFQEQSGPKIQKQLRKIIEAFITEERP